MLGRRFCTLGGGATVSWGQIIGMLALPLLYDWGDATVRWECRNRRLLAPLLYAGGADT